MTHRTDVLRFLIDQVDSAHVVMGSDYPFEMGDPNPVETVRAVPEITEDQTQLILYEPTNGTVSFGSIYRVGGNSGGDSPDDDPGEEGDQAHV